MIDLTQVELAASLGGGHCRAGRADESGAPTTGGRVHSVRLGRDPWEPRVGPLGPLDRVAH